MFKVIKTKKDAILVRTGFINQALSDEMKALGYRYKCKNSIDGYYKPIKKHLDSDVQHLVVEG